MAKRDILGSLPRSGKRNGSDPTHWQQTRMSGAPINGTENHDKGRSDYSGLKARSREGRIARGGGRRHDGFRSPRTWPAKRTHGVLSGTRVHGGLDPEGKTRDRPGRRNGREGRAGDHDRGAYGEDRRREDFSFAH